MPRKQAIYDVYVDMKGVVKAQVSAFSETDALQKFFVMSRKEWDVSNLDVIETDFFPGYATRTDRE